MHRLPILLVLMAAAAPTATTFAQNPIALTARLQDREERRERQRQSTRETQTERHTQTVNIGAEGQLDVFNISGDVKVTRGGGSSATIEVIKTARASTADEARTVLALVTVEIAERSGRAEVRARYPDQEELRRSGRRNVNVDVAINISAPQNARVTVKSISGNVSVSDITGAVALESVSGSVRVANAGRVSSAKSISGNVDVINTRVDGALDAGTISGIVRIQGTTARSLTLGSVSGSVVIEDVTCDRIDAQSISGDVQFSGDFQPNGRYDLKSHSGNVRLSLGTKTGFQVEATSFSGSVRTDLPLTLRGSQSAGRQRNLRGTFGDGSALVELTSFSGSVVIGKR
jgi:Putative adhesin